MNLISREKFVNKYNGKEAAVPWGYSGECVSLVQRYTNECFGVPLARRGDAKFYGRNLVNNGYATYVTLPQYGDIIVWGDNMGGGYGHVAIYIDSGSMFDQNNATVRPTRTARVRPLLKTKPLHYVRMKKAPVIDGKGEYKNEVYAFTNKSGGNINLRDNHTTSAKVVGKLANNETYNYIKKFEDGKHVWVSNGKTWIAVREVKNGVRQELWGTLQAQVDKPVQPPVNKPGLVHGLKPSGKFKFEVDTPVRIRWGLNGSNSKDSGVKYGNGDTVNYQSVYTQGGFVWLGYKASDGTQCTVAVGQVGKKPWGRNV